MIRSVLLICLSTGLLHAEPEVKEGNPKLRAKTQLLLAKALQEQGKADEAIGAYARIWIQHAGQVEVASEALTAGIQLLWERNRPAKGVGMSDRDLAVESGHIYVRQMAVFESKMTKDERAAWLKVDALVKEYQAKLKE